jgi:hypothetical protein
MSAPDAPAMEIDSGNRTYAALLIGLRGVQGRHAVTSQLAVPIRTPPAVT